MVKVTESSTLEKYAKRMAQALCEEFDHANRTPATDATRQKVILPATPAERPKFTMKDGVQTARTETTLKQTRDLRFIYSPCDGVFILSAGTAIDHVEPYKDLLDRAKSFLRFLQNNSGFAEVLLTQGPMRDYFVKEGDAYYFTKHGYRALYNNANNLWLLSIHKNSSKGGDNPLAWFLGQEEFFGQAFIDYIEGQEAYHQGVFFHRVFKANTARDVQVSIDGFEFVLPNEGASPRLLGQCVKEWVEVKHKDRYETLGTVQEGIVNLFENALDAAKTDEERKVVGAAASRVSSFADGTLAHPLSQGAGGASGLSDAERAVISSLSNQRARDYGVLTTLLNGVATRLTAMGLRGEADRTQKMTQKEFDDFKAWKKKNAGRNRLETIEVDAIAGYFERNLLPVSDAPPSPLSSLDSPGGSPGRDEAVNDSQDDEVRCEATDPHPEVAVFPAVTAPAVVRRRSSSSEGPDEPPAKRPRMEGQAQDSAPTAPGGEAFRCANRR